MSLLLKLTASSLAAMAISASAAGVVGTYTALGGNQWSLAFTVSNMVDPTPVHQFTVYFDESLFDGLLVTGSPSTWDSLVIQGDVGIPAPGFFDGLVLDPDDALGLGEDATGFSVTFDYLGVGVPGSLPFDFLDAEMNVIASGRTTVTATGGTPLHAPPTSLLLATAAILGVLRGYRTARTT